MSDQQAIQHEAEKQDDADEALADSEVEEEASAPGLAWAGDVGEKESHSSEGSAQEPTTVVDDIAQDMLERHGDAGEKSSLPNTFIVVIIVAVFISLISLINISYERADADRTASTRKIFYTLTRQSIQRGMAENREFQNTMAILHAHGSSRENEEQLKNKILDAMARSKADACFEMLTQEELNALIGNQCDPERYGDVIGKGKIIQVNNRADALYGALIKANEKAQAEKGRGLPGE